MSETITTYEDVLNMLDSLLREPTAFWDGFYENREKKIPFFENLPDENLIHYFDSELLGSGRVLELGCGPGRNAIYLAQKGCSVDAVDLSKEALEWGKERAAEKKVHVNFIQRNIFELEVEEGQYDFVYDSGCFHHIAPHRRINYLEMVKKALKPKGLYSIICFVEGGILGGADISDWEVYRQRSLKGGLGFSEEKIKTIFKDFEVVEIRKMRNMEQSKEAFGVQGLWTGLFMKK
ncbi:MULTISPECIES: class I SAM-dependent methyltransferase [unclassified Peribacillus]|uniref:class I SAM-dependent methyltransferase n=1 Tax=unclassified Peribacillus TaxID=2675266 RepID=UPI001E4C310A|nr:class I SAM-dependent methyltransferase [Peribacillus sp. Bi96]